MSNADATLTGLRARWAALALTSAGMLLIFWTTIRSMLSTGAALRWLPPALMVATVVLGALWRQLDLNRIGDGQLLATLGLANLITVLRGLLIALVAGFIAVPPNYLTNNPALMWLPGILFIVALLLDLADGSVARRYDRLTELGRRLDTQIDGVTVLTGCLLAAVWSKAPVWFIMAGLAYYLFVGGCRLRERWFRPCGVLPPSKIRRFLAGLMMTMVGIILLPPVSPALGRLTAIFVAAPFLANFIWDWITVCRVKPSLPESP